MYLSLTHLPLLQWMEPAGQAYTEDLVSLTLTYFFQIIISKSSCFFKFSINQAVFVLQNCEVIMRSGNFDNIASEILEG